MNTKGILLTLILILAFAISGCSSKDTKPKVTPTPAASPTQPGPNPKPSNDVAYRLVIFVEKDPKIKIYSGLGSVDPKVGAKNLKLLDGKIEFSLGKLEPFAYKWDEKRSSLFSYKAFEEDKIADLSEVAIKIVNKAEGKEFTSDKLNLSDPKFDKVVFPELAKEAKFSSMQNLEFKDLPQSGDAKLYYKVCELKHCDDDKYLYRNNVSIDKDGNTLIEMNKVNESFKNQIADLKMDLSGSTIKMTISTVVYSEVIKDKKLSDKFDFEVSLYLLNSLEIGY